MLAGAFPCLDILSSVKPACPALVCWCLGPLSDCGGVCLNCSKQAPSGSIAVHIQDFDHLCLAALSLHISAPCTPLLQQHLSPELHTSLPTFPCTLHLHSCTSALLSSYLSTTMALHPKQCTFCGMSGHLAGSCFRLHNASHQAREEVRETYSAPFPVTTKSRRRKLFSHGLWWTSQHNIELPGHIHWPDV